MTNRFLSGELSLLTPLITGRNFNRLYELFVKVLIFRNTKIGRKSKPWTTT